jgi:hypothetical protein
MIVVEVHAHVTIFLPLSCELSVTSLSLTHCYFFGEKCGDEIFIYFC